MIPSEALYNAIPPIGKKISWDVLSQSERDIYLKLAQVVIDASGQEVENQKLKAQLIAVLRQLYSHTGENFDQIVKSIAKEVEAKIEKTMTQQNNIHEHMKALVESEKCKMETNLALEDHAAGKTLTSLAESLEICEKQLNHEINCYRKLKDSHDILFDALKRACCALDLLAPICDLAVCARNDAKEVLDKIK